MDVSDTSETDQLDEVPEDTEVVTENNQEETQLPTESSYCKEAVLKFSCFRTIRTINTYVPYFFHKSRGKKDNFNPNREIMIYICTE